MKDEQVEDNYRCKRHFSTYGYKDEEGNWHCWACYKENRYLNPQGEISNNYTSKGFHARIVLHGDHGVQMEMWDIRDKTKPKLINQNPYNYLSQAMRDWYNWIELIESGEVIATIRTQRNEEEPGTLQDLMAQHMRRRRT